MYFHLLSIELHQQQLEHVPLHFLNEYSKVLICRQLYQKQYLRTQFTNCLLLQSGRSAMTAIQLKKTQQKTHYTYSVSSSPCKGECGEFVLESFNRKGKRLLPSRLPDDQGWIRTCQNVKLMTNVKIEHRYNVQFIITFNNL